MKDCALLCYADDVAALNNTLYYLGRNLKSGAFDFVMLQAREDRGVLVFQEVALASKHLRNLPEEVGVHALEDYRAKEEFVRAALQQGVTQLWFDVDAESLEPIHTRPLAEALFYVLSFKREVACL